MHNLNDHYDRMLASYRDQLEQLELFISSKLNNEPTETYTDAQMMEHLRRIDETFKSVASGVYRTHSQVQVRVVFDFVIVILFTTCFRISRMLLCVIDVR
jgi:hypothetical protein